MAASTTTSALYIHVIEDVINKVRDEFINNGGPGESVLNDLQGIWEMKMMHAGVICGPIERSSAPKPIPGGPLTHDLNVPYEGAEEYETPTAEMLFPPTPLPTPLPGTADNSSMYNIPTGSSGYPTPASENGNVPDLKGSPSPYMPSSSPWSNPRLDVNVAYVNGQNVAERGNSNQQLTQDFFVPSSVKRKREDFPAQYPNGGSIPQQDGANDAVSKGTEGESVTNEFSRNVSGNFISSSLKIPQVDGPMPDPYDDILSTPNIYSYQGVNEDYNEAKTPALNETQASTLVAAQNDEDDDELLNEDDDDDELDDLDSGEDVNTQHLVLAQFDKVSRTKSRWKCTLKDGIMHINDKDILFNKATGEFDF
ncbi:PREDICTED: transcription initiation factor IIA subunit 1-like [Tarenaya hassleriana]|uniref:transcription initiation factor IIA subunit 1-like n=1 Tax=Tarenaya hassleriana TaxID=28532 RepID=UPI00053C65D1|nr:PREDICTED: transcription initiation factor IIA subunit 1-like [Tarenaya hassleriana]